MTRIYKSILKLLVAFSLLFVQSAHAKLATSMEMLNSAKKSQTIRSIEGYLNQEQVVKALENQGIEKSEVEQRLALLSHDQLIGLQNNLEAIPAGAGAAGAIVGAILIVFFVLLFTDLIGATDVFDFDHGHVHH